MARARFSRRIREIVGSRKSILGSILLITSLAVAGELPAAAQEPWEDGPSAEVLERQAEIHQITDQIWSKVYAGDAPGFTGIEQSEGAETYTVYWKGSPPAWVVDLMASDPFPPGRIALTEHSFEELTGANSRLREHAAAQGLGLEGTIMAIDGSEIIAQVNSNRLGRYAGKNKAETSQDLSEQARMPVRVEYVEGSHVPLQQRNDDSPPWDGGGARDPGTWPYFDCSVGFAVRNSNWQVRLLSAEHCLGGTNATITDGAGDHLGTVTVWDRDVDSEIIDPTSTTPGYGYVFKGSWYTNNKIPVTGSTYNNKGDFVCRSGQNTGTICNIRIISLYATWGSRTGIFHLGQRNLEGPVVAVAQGDSGGPVYQPASGGNAAVAAGIVSFGDWEVPCDGAMRNYNVICAKQVGFMSYMALTQRWNVSTIVP